MEKKSKKVEEDEINNNAECEKKSSDFPYDIVDVDPETNAELLKDFTGKFKKNSVIKKYFCFKFNNV